MKVEKFVREKREVEVCDRCKKLAATHGVVVISKGLNSGMTLTAADADNFTWVPMCGQCCDHVFKSMNVVQRPRKTKAPVVETT